MLKEKCVETILVYRDIIDHELSVKVRASPPADVITSSPIPETVFLLYGGPLKRR